MFVRQANDGNWYVCRKTSSNSRGRTNKFPRGTQSTFRNWFLVKHKGNLRDKGGIISCGNFFLCLPKQFIGKKVMLKLEVIEIPRK